jgi:hypothetical protein
VLLPFTLCCRAHPVGYQRPSSGVQAIGWLAVRLTADQVWQRKSELEATAQAALAAQRLSVVEPAVPPPGPVSGLEALVEAETNLAAQQRGEL